MTASDGRPPKPPRPSVWKFVPRQVGMFFNKVPAAGRAWVRGRSKMHESEYVVCPCCGETMQRAQTAFHAELLLETFECKPCGVAVTAEAVSGTHMLIE